MAALKKLGASRRAFRWNFLRAALRLQSALSRQREPSVKTYRAEFKRAPDFVAVGAYDGMHVIYEALKKTNGNGDGDALISAAKGMRSGEPARTYLDSTIRRRAISSDNLYPRSPQGGRQLRERHHRQDRGGWKDPILEGLKRIVVSCASTERQRYAASPPALWENNDGAAGI